MNERISVTASFVERASPQLRNASIGVTRVARHPQRRISDRLLVCAGARGPGVKLACDGMDNGTIMDAWFNIL